MSLEKQDNNKITESSKNTPNVKKNFFLNTLYEVLCVITPFITTPYLSRVLGADQIGVNSFVCSIQTFFVMFSVLGAASYGGREIARNRDNIQNLSRVFWEVEFLIIITSSITMAGWFLLILFTNQYKIYYLILTLGIINSIFNISWFYAGLEQFKYTILKNTIVKIIGIVMILTLVKKPEDLYKFILINSAFGLLGSISMWFTLKKFLVKVKFRELKIFRHLKGTLIFFIPTIATSIYTVLDKTLIGLITKEEAQNGYYEQANKILNIVKVFVFGSLNGVMGSRISYLFAKNKTEEIKERIDKSINFVLLIGIGCCFGLTGVMKNFVPFFFGPGYEQVTTLIYILSPIVLIIGISNCLGSLYYAPAGKQIESSIYLIIGATCNLVANIFLIPRFKAFGAAIGSIIAETIITIIFFSRCHGYYSLKKLISALYKKLIAGIVMFSYLCLIDRFVKLPNLPLLAIQITGGIIIYFVLLLVMKDSIMQLVLNLNIIKKIRSKFTGK